MGIVPLNDILYDRITLEQIMISISIGSSAYIPFN